MCIDAKTSIVSFVVGSIINISVMLYVRKPVVTQICLIWQWVLMMQLAEYLIWSDEDCGVVNYTGTKMAMMVNLTQPIVCFFVFFFMNDKPKSFQIASIVIVMVYIMFMFQYLNSQKEYQCTKKGSQCSALDWLWCKDTIVHVAYIGTVLLTLFILSDMSPLIVFTIFYLAITLIVSDAVYSCGAPSMWCWMVVPFPLLLGGYNVMIGSSL